jgi:hypothetical protein
MLEKSSLSDETSSVGEFTESKKGDSASLFSLSLFWTFSLYD